ncbi:uncharacterized protein EAE97_005461 [Botrytis byssoidea]|uniref:SH3 domain-containing protein n=1 Tax=Botrytis byssoidea TaxID=139641 RepID=A0A9P5ITC3_9HELO|nr:uncharacterized protein EAE97_005461 [Botrytis byssoidea]KAF7944828.1 hypothetical protein EAE97_005461 [Botrytis byssoidea]
MKGRSHQHARHAKRAELNQEDIMAAPIEVRQPDPEPEPALQTIVSVVYVTASPTFSGSIAGYSTVGQEDETTSSAEETHSSTKTTAAKTTATSSSASHTTTSASTLKTSASSSSELPSSLVATTSVGSSVALLAATDNIPTSTAVASATNASSANASSTAAADSSSSGMSAGGKAGLVVGILLLLGVGLALLLFFFKKKKQAAKAERLDDEKSAMVASSARRAEATRAEVQRQASQRSDGGGAAAATAAHRLSLRPVTQFQPFNEKSRASQAPSQMGGILTPVSTAPSYHSQQFQDQNKNNPFGNHAESIDTPNTNGPPIIEGFNDGGEVIAASAVVAAAASSSTSNSPTPAPLKPVGLARSASKAGNSLKMDFTTKPNTVLSPPSPSGSEFSTASGATQAQSVTGMAIAAAGGPPNTTVHRVQLDFVPSMDDELELKAGQLIRILHEYDDGWALCIRLDRSKQGVVPRTCLSTRPVKPRPQQPGPQGSPAMRPQQRPMSPGMNQGPPRVPNKDGGPPYPASPMKPNGPPNGPPRPMGPNGQGPPRGPGMMQGPPRSMSPAGPPRPMGPNGQGPPRGPGMMQGPPRSMSPAGNRPMTPQGKRPMVPPNHPNQQRPMTPQGSSVPRPMTPQGQATEQRPITPPNHEVAPQSEGRARSDSDTDPISRQASPTLITSAPTDTPSSPPPALNIRSPVERKPVPGQAM